MSLALLGHLQLLPLTGPRSPYQPTDCCFTYLARAIPRERISSYYETSSQCTKPGIIFITKRNREICTNPGDTWVQEYIKDPKLSLQPSRVSA
uniref:C-C motif chemokine n=1 Tax=Catagonus wagneri TaxID=51154 RepID=A0A8C3YF08_9CETA